jgi:hypothetical protein
LTEVSHGSFPEYFTSRFSWISDIISGLSFIEAIKKMKAQSVLGAFLIGLGPLGAGEVHALEFSYCVPDTVCDSRVSNARQAGYDDGYSDGSADGRSKGYSDGYTAGTKDGRSSGYSEGYTAGTKDGRSTGYSEGYSAGSTAGYDNGYAVGLDEGYEDGNVDGIAACQADPASFGITLDSLLPPAEYGETEYNDNMVGADPLVLGAKFWGQVYGMEDQDWYFFMSDRPNKVLTILFSVPGRDANSSNEEDWAISVRDAAGNLYAQFVAGNPKGGDEIAYPVTLGFAGTYYVVVEADDPDTLSYDPYNLSINLQDSSLDSANFLIGAYDAEREPNDFYDIANRVSSGVTVYGLINLTFDTALPQADRYVWAQGENDWYFFDSPGEEVVTISFCEREYCEPGNWYVEVYDSQSVGEPSSEAKPLVAYNTDVCAAGDTASCGRIIPGTGEPIPHSVRFGLTDPGRYYMRVYHKRTFDAPCAGYALDTDNNGIVDGGACSCDTGYSCEINVRNPGNDPAFCPDGTPLEEGGIQCPATCRCVAWGGVVELPENEVTSQYNFTLTGSRMTPDTGSTDRYQDYLSRPAFALVDEAQKAYIAFYQRPAEPEGLAYWSNRLAGDPGGMNALVSAFATSEEAEQLYGGLSREQLLETLYNGLFGRSLDSEGRTYWLGRLASGSSTVDRIMLQIMDGAQGGDAAVMANKLAVAKYVTDQVDTYGKTWDSEAARSVLSGVTAAAASVAEAKALASQLFGFPL